MEENTEKRNNVLCVDLGNKTAKIIFIEEFPIGVQVGRLSDPDVQQKFRDNICYMCGYWMESMKKNGYKVLEIDFIFPQIGVYLDLEKDLISFYLKESVKLRFLSGRIFNSCDEDHHKEVTDFCQNSLNNN